MNHTLVQKSYHPVETKRVSSTVNNTNVSVTKAIADSIWEKNKVKMDEVISKKRLGEILIQPRIDGIRKERYGEGWKPILPIEKILEGIFDMIPRVIG